MTKKRRAPKSNSPPPSTSSNQPEDSPAQVEETEMTLSVHEKDMTVTIHPAREKRHFVFPLEFVFPTSFFVLFVFICQKYGWWAKTISQ